MAEIHNEIKKSHKNKMENQTIKTKHRHTKSPEKIYSFTNSDHLVESMTNNTQIQTPNSNQYRCEFSHAGSFIPLVKKHDTVKEINDPTSPKCSRQSRHKHVAAESEVKKRTISSGHPIVEEYQKGGAVRKQSPEVLFRREKSHEKHPMLKKEVPHSGRVKKKSAHNLKHKRSPRSSDQRRRKRTSPSDSWNLEMNTNTQHVSEELSSKPNRISKNDNYFKRIGSWLKNNFVYILSLKENDNPVSLEVMDGPSESERQKLNKTDKHESKAFQQEIQNSYSEVGKDVAKVSKNLLQVSASSQKNNKKSDMFPLDNQKAESRYNKVHKSLSPKTVRRQLENDSNFSVNKGSPEVITPRMSKKEHKYQINETGGKPVPSKTSKRKLQKHKIYYVNPEISENLKSNTIADKMRRSKSLSPTPSKRHISNNYKVSGSPIIFRELIVNSSSISGNASLSPKPSTKNEIKTDKSNESPTAPESLHIKDKDKLMCTFLASNTDNNQRKSNLSSKRKDKVLHDSTTRKPRRTFKNNVQASRSPAESKQFISHNKKQSNIIEENDKSCKECFTQEESKISVSPKHCGEILSSAESISINGRNSYCKLRARYEINKYKSKNGKYSKKANVKDHNDSIIVLDTRQMKKIPVQPTDNKNSNENSSDLLSLDNKSEIRSSKNSKKESIRNVNNDTIPQKSEENRVESNKITYPSGKMRNKEGKQHTDKRKLKSSEVHRTNNKCDRTHTTEKKYIEKPTMKKMDDTGFINENDNYANLQADSFHSLNLRSNEEAETQQVPLKITEIPTIYCVTGTILNTHLQNSNGDVNNNILEKGKDDEVNINAVHSRLEEYDSEKLVSEKPMCTVKDTSPECYMVPEVGDMDSTKTCRGESQKPSPRLYAEKITNTSNNKGICTMSSSGYMPSIEFPEDICVDTDTPEKLMLQSEKNATDKEIQCCSAEISTLLNIHHLEEDKNNILISKPPIGKRFERNFRKTSSVTDGILTKQCQATTYLMKTSHENLKTGQMHSVFTAERNSFKECKAVHNSHSPFKNEKHDITRSFSAPNQSDQSVVVYDQKNHADPGISDSEQNMLIESDMKNNKIHNAVIRNRACSSTVVHCNPLEITNFERNASTRTSKSGSTEVRMNPITKFEIYKSLKNVITFLEHSTKEKILKNPPTCDAVLVEDIRFHINTDINDKGIEYSAHSISSIGFSNCVQNSTSAVGINGNIDTGERHCNANGECFPKVCTSETKTNNPTCSQICLPSQNVLSHVPSEPDSLVNNSIQDYVKPNLAADNNECLFFASVGNNSNNSSRSFELFSEEFPKSDKCIDIVANNRTKNNDKALTVICSINYEQDEKRKNKDTFTSTQSLPDNLQLPHTVTSVQDVNKKRTTIEGTHEKGTVEIKDNCKPSPLEQIPDSSDIPDNTFETAETLSDWNTKDKVTDLNTGSSDKKENMRATKKQFKSENKTNKFAGNKIKTHCCNLNSTNIQLNDSEQRELIPDPPEYFKIEECFESWWTYIQDHNNTGIVEKETDSLSAKLFTLTTTDTENSVNSERNNEYQEMQQMGYKPKWQGNKRFSSISLPMVIIKSSSSPFISKTDLPKKHDCLGQRGLPRDRSQTITVPSAKVPFTDRDIRVMNSSNLLRSDSITSKKVEPLNGKRSSVFKSASPRYTDTVKKKENAVSVHPQSKNKPGDMKRFPIKCSNSSLKYKEIVPVIYKIHKAKEVCDNTQPNNGQQCMGTVLNRKKENEEKQSVISQESRQVSPRGRKGGNNDSCSVHSHESKKTICRQNFAKEEVESVYSQEKELSYDSQSLISQESYGKSYTKKKANNCVYSVSQESRQALHKTKSLAKKGSKLKLYKSKGDAESVINKECKTKPTGKYKYTTTKAEISQRTIEASATNDKKIKDLQTNRARPCTIGKLNAERAKAKATDICLDNNSTGQVLPSTGVIRSCNYPQKPKNVIQRKKSKPQIPSKSENKLKRPYMPLIKQTSSKKKPLNKSKDSNSTLVISKNLLDNKSLEPHFENMKIESNSHKKDEKVDEKEPSRNISQEALTTCLNDKNVDENHSVGSSHVANINNQKSESQIPTLDKTEKNNRDILNTHFEINTEHLFPELHSKLDQSCETNCASNTNKCTKESPQNLDSQIYSVVSKTESIQHSVTSHESKANMPELQGYSTEKLAKTGVNRLTTDKSSRTINSEDEKVLSAFKGKRFEECKCRECNEVLKENIFDILSCIKQKCTSERSGENSEDPVQVPVLTIHSSRYLTDVIDCKVNQTEERTACKSKSYSCKNENPKGIEDKEKLGHKSLSSELMILHYVDEENKYFQVDQFSATNIDNVDVTKEKYLSKNETDIRERTSVFNIYLNPSLHTRKSENSVMVHKNLSKGNIGTIEHILSREGILSTMHHVLLNEDDSSTGQNDERTVNSRESMNINFTDIKSKNTPVNTINPTHDFKNNIIIEGHITNVKLSNFSKGGLEPEETKNKSNPENMEYMEETTDIRNIESINAQPRKEFTPSTSQSSHSVVLDNVQSIKNNTTKDVTIGHLKEEPQTHNVSVSSLSTHCNDKRLDKNKMKNRVTYVVRKDSTNDDIIDRELHYKTVNDSSISYNINKTLDNFQTVRNGRETNNTMLNDPSPIVIDKKAELIEDTLKRRDFKVQRTELLLPLTPLKDNQFPLSNFQLYIITENKNTSQESSPLQDPTLKRSSHSPPASRGISSSVKSKAHHVSVSLTKYEQNKLLQNYLPLKIEEPLSPGKQGLSKPSKTKIPITEWDKGMYEVTSQEELSVVNTLPKEYSGIFTPEKSGSAEGIERERRLSSSQNKKISFGQRDSRVQRPPSSFSLLSTVSPGSEPYRNGFVMESPMEIQREFEPDKNKKKSKFFSKFKNLCRKKRKQSDAYRKFDEQQRLSGETSKGTKIKISSDEDVPMTGYAEPKPKEKKEIIYNIDSWEIGNTLRQGFRPDDLSLSGQICIGNNREVLETDPPMISIHDSEDPATFLYRLGINVDKAEAMFVRDKNLNGRIRAALREASIWTDEVTKKQAILLLHLAHKAKPEVLGWYPNLVEAIVNNRIKLAKQINGILERLENVAEEKKVRATRISTTSYRAHKSSSPMSVRQETERAHTTKLARVLSSSMDFEYSEYPRKSDDSLNLKVPSRRRSNSFQRNSKVYQQGSPERIKTRHRKHI